MARYKIECCYKCPNRHAECHSTCERYKTQKAEYDATMTEVKKKEDVQKDLKGFLIENIERTNKRLRRNRW